MEEMDTDKNSGPKGVDLSRLSLLSMFSWFLSPVSPVSLLNQHLYIIIGPSALARLGFRVPDFKFYKSPITSHESRHFL